MFYELIYTRCRKGMDILKKGQPITTDGYKVYSCAPQIMDEGKLDLPLFSAATIAKQSYTDPSFMDDAYLYFAPDNGENFLINFHPVPFNPNTEGDYSHRPGNFVNHALVGNFTNFYTYELLGDPSIWTARRKSEAYYYETEPSPLPPRTDIVDPPGKYLYDDIAAFIADGRAEALKCAVAFLLEQFEQEPENRKYLVIKDETSDRIELWIAAIQCALSPRMAAAVSFATRMDKYATANRYTVNLSGAYQASINLQDPKQKQRFRAMIVGVDERDKANAASVRVIQSSPFAVLDGKEKRAQFEVDTSNEYFSLITRFNDEHLNFCRQFLQMLDISAPSRDVFALRDAYRKLFAQTLPSARDVAAALAVINRYKIHANGAFKDIYIRVGRELSRMLREDFVSALQVMGWLKSASQTAGDSAAATRLSRLVCDALADAAFGKCDASATRVVWSQIKQSEYAGDVARFMSDMRTYQEHTEDFRRMTHQCTITVTLVYFEAAAMSGAADRADVERMLGYGLEIARAGADMSAVSEMASAVSQIRGLDAHEMLFSVARSSGGVLGEFVVSYMIEGDGAAIASDQAVYNFCTKLKAEGLGQLAIAALLKRADRLSTLTEIEQFLDMSKSLGFLNQQDIARIYETVDSKLDISARGAHMTAEAIQLQRPVGAKCLRSAHLYALAVLSGVSPSRRKTELANALDLLIKQGFPSISGKQYMQTLADCAIKAPLTEAELEYITEMLQYAPQGYLQAYALAVCAQAAKRPDAWNSLIRFAAEDPSDEDMRNTTFGEIVNALIETKQTERSLAALGDMLQGKTAKGYYESAAAHALSAIQAQKPRSGFARVLGFFGGDSRKDGK